MSCCLNCGARIPDGSDTCPVCGQTTRSAPVKEPTRQRRWPIFGFIGFIAIGVILTIYLPDYLGHKAEIHNSEALDYLEMAAEAQREYFESHGIYSRSIDRLLRNEKWPQISDDVVISIKSADVRHYTMEAHHVRGDRIYEIIGPKRQVKIYLWKNKRKGKQVNY